MLYPFNRNFCEFRVFKIEKKFIRLLTSAGTVHQFFLRYSKGTLMCVPNFSSICHRVLTRKILVCEIKSCAKSPRVLEKIVNSIFEFLNRTWYIKLYRNLLRFVLKHIKIFNQPVFVCMCIWSLLHSCGSPRFWQVTKYRGGSGDRWLREKERWIFLLLKICLGFGTHPRIYINLMGN